jgi:hypothetical protein
MSTCHCLLRVSQAGPVQVALRLGDSQYCDVDGNLHPAPPVGTQPEWNLLLTIYCIK